MRTILYSGSIITGLNRNIKAKKQRERQHKRDLLKAWLAGGGSPTITNSNIVFYPQSCLLRTFNFWYNKQNFQL